MNDIFLTLPMEKQQRIINAALEVFAKNEYKQASTDDIASRAGISKGSLFYYFKNKKSLYMYIFEYVSKMMQEAILDNHFKDITDFFELMHYGAKQKAMIIEKNPYILDFTVQFFYQQEWSLSTSIYTESFSTRYFEYFTNIDFSKFKEEVNPLDIYNYIVYATLGYLYSKRFSKEKVSLETLMSEFEKWATMFKAFSYKEEYLHEYNGSEKHY